MGQRKEKVLIRGKIALSSKHVFSKGAEYASKSARTDTQFINRITHDDRGRNLGIRKGIERNTENSRAVL
jgi:phage terminase large subunit